MEYKLSKYLYIKKFKKAVLIYSLIQRKIFAISTSDYQLITSQHLSEIKDSNPYLFSALEKLGVIIQDDYNELDFIKAKNKENIFDKSYYRLIINPTLECNFHCWYCYEHHPKGRMGSFTMDAIEQHLRHKIEQENLKYLSVDWFGGEPLLCFNDVIHPLSKRIIQLFGSIQYKGSMTTNGYLITPKMVEQFDKISLTNFQITLDGDEEMHNSIRFVNGHKGSFNKIIENINLLSENEKNTIMVRINYTKDTLLKINEIAERFTENAKKRTTINFQQVWQDSIKKFVSADENINYFNRLGFSVNYGSLHTGYHVCYADLLNEAVINFDGRVFKCTARNFATQKEDGLLQSNGEIIWYNNNYAKRFGKATFENEHCLKCIFLPVCSGPCSQKMVEFRNIDDFQPLCLKEGVREILDRQIDNHYLSIKSLIQ